MLEGALAEANSEATLVPLTVARAVFEALLNASVLFEECVFEAFKAVAE